MMIKSNMKNENATVEVLPEGSYARVRVREIGTTWLAKASVFLEPAQLEELGQGCLVEAKRIREQVR